MIFKSFLRVFMLHFRGSFSQKIFKKQVEKLLFAQKKLEQVRKSLFQILLERDYWKLLN